MLIYSESTAKVHREKQRERERETFHASRNLLKVSEPLIFVKTIQKEEEQKYNTAILDWQTPAECSLKCLFLGNNQVLGVFEKKERNREKSYLLRPAKSFFIHTTLSFLHPMQSRFDRFGSESESLSTSVIK